MILYRPDGLEVHIEVKIVEETVWLNRQQIALLFNRDVKTIGKHIQNVFAEEELIFESTVANFATVQNEGGRIVERQIEYYNLDVIISVGYRVKSKQGTQFRIWANRVLKDHLLKGYSVNNRLIRLENDVNEIQKKVDEIDFQIRGKQIPAQGVFFEGQIFDAYELASRIIRSARESVVLIDNYIDETSLALLCKKQPGVKLLLLSKADGREIQLDVAKARAQYGDIELIRFSRSHDRFLVIDNEEIYHLGASLKDLGKRWFAFSKLETETVKSLIAEIRSFLS